MLRASVGNVVSRGVVIDRFGDAAVNVSADHQSRHDGVKAVWVRACKAARAQRILVEDPYHRRYSGKAGDGLGKKRPDITVLNGGYGACGAADTEGRHLLLDVKVRAPLTAHGVPHRADGAFAAFGGVASAVDKEMDKEYAAARSVGHTARPLIHCVFGGLERRAAETLADLDRRFKGRLGDPADAPWNARTFLARYAQQLSIAAQREVARQVFAAGTGMHARI